MREEAQALTSGWSSGQPIDFDKEMSQLALAIVAKAIFSSELCEAACFEVQRSLPIVNHGTFIRTLLPDHWERVPVAANRRFEAARLRLRAVIHDAVERYRTDGVDHGDLLSALVNARYDRTGAPMSDRQVCDEVITVLMAGTETTATTLTWLFYELGRAPRIESELHAELDALLEGRSATYADVPQLCYLAQILNEVTRLHAPVWFLMRRSTAPVEFGATWLPVGSQVIYSPTALHRDPRLYPNPLIFDPDRWRSERAQQLPKFAFIPFGAGQHQCIGLTFAQIELSIVVAEIASHWRLQLDTSVRVLPRPLATLRPTSLRLIPNSR
jgi:cytochrome P450